MAILLSYVYYQLIDITITHHTIALSFDWEKSTTLLSTVSSKNCLLNNTVTMWCFLIKEPYLGKLRVMCDAENNLSSNEKQNCN